ncbi:MAG: DegV family protein [Anaerolineae bacterium]
MPVKIVTDTGCDLPAPLIEQYDIHLVPLVLRFGERDVDDSPATRAELWQRVEAGLPCETSGPPVGAYQIVFAPLVQAGHEIVCITLTGAHSITYGSAALAAQDFPGQITVIDGCSISLGYGLQVLEAAHLAAAGASRQAVADAVRSAQQRLTIRFFLESLDQVKRGGRLDGLMPMLNRLGAALNIRAVLTVNSDGRISLVGPARGRRGALKRVAQDIVATGPVERLAVAHSRALDEAEALADELAVALNFPRSQIMMVEIGSVLVAHAGQGLLGAGSIRAR